MIQTHCLNIMLCYAKSFQSCPTLCNPIDGSPPGSPIPGILQARILEWVAISFPNAWKWKEKVKSLSLVWLSATPWTAAYQAPPSMGFSRQEYWSGCHCLLQSEYYTITFHYSLFIDTLDISIFIFLFLKGMNEEEKEKNPTLRTDKTQNESERKI